MTNFQNLHHSSISCPKAYPQGRPALGYRYILVTLLTITLLMGCTEGRFSAEAGWSGVIDGGDLVYVGSMEGQLLALDAATGATEWKFPRDNDESTVGFNAIYGTPSLVDGIVYAAGYNGRAYAVTAGRIQNGGGIKEWEFEVGTGVYEEDTDEQSKGIVGSVVVADGKAMLGAALDSERGRFYVLDAANGRQHCAYPQNGSIGKIWSTPAVADGIAYFGDLNHNFYAVSTEDCTLQWTEPAELDGGIASTPFIVGQKVYVGAFDRTFYEIDTMSGETNPIFTADNWFWSGIVRHGNTLFIPSLDGRLYSLSLTTGSPPWPPFDTQGPILSTPVVVGDRVVVASDDEKLFVINAIEGTEEWYVRVGAKIRAPLMAKDNVVYLSTTDHKIHAIDIEKGNDLRGWPVKTD